MNRKKGRKLRKNGRIEYRKPIPPQEEEFELPEINFSSDDEEIPSSFTVFGNSEAPFIENVDFLMYIMNNDVEGILERYEKYLEEYDILKAKYTVKRKSLKREIQEYEKVIGMLILLMQKNRRHEKIETTFRLSTHILVEAVVPPSDTVLMTRGVETLVHYSLEDALFFQRKDLNVAKEMLSLVEHELTFVCDQHLTIQTNIVRIKNWEIKKKRNKNEETKSMYSLFDPDGTKIVLKSPSKVDSSRKSMAQATFIKQGSFSDDSSLLPSKKMLFKKSLAQASTFVGQQQSASSTTASSASSSSFPSKMNPFQKSLLRNDSLASALSRPAKVVNSPPKLARPSKMIGKHLSPSSTSFFNEKKSSILTDLAKSITKKQSLLETDKSRLTVANGSYSLYKTT